MCHDCFPLLAKGGVDWAILGAKYRSRLFLLAVGNQVVKMQRVQTHLQTQTHINAVNRAPR